MSPLVVGAMWLGIAVGLLVLSMISGEPLGATYWFFLGTSQFFLGVHHIVKAIKQKEIAA